ncbi:MAG: hypothetical protein WAU49_17310 [Steroidobacteraceae bacterium]
MEGIEIDVRSKVIAAQILLGIALNALKEGSDDPEEQPDYLVREVLGVLDGVVNDLAQLSAVLDVVGKQIERMFVRS